jgi:hypothetical protein
MRLQTLGKLVRATLDFDRTRLPLVFYFVAIFSVAGLIVNIFRWMLVDLLTVFLEPMVEIAVFSAFAAVLVWAIVHAILPFRGARGNRFSPLLLGLTSLAVFLFVPFNEIELDINFSINVQSRTDVAQRVLAKIPSAAPMLGGRGDFVHLTGSEYRLSDDGDVMVWHTAQKQMVFFFTFRGVLDSFSGFVYSANDLPPENEDFGGEWVEVTRLRKNWYWAASRN